MEIRGRDRMAAEVKETLITKLTLRIKEQLVINGITDFTITDGNFHFVNMDEKARANVIIRDYLTDILDNNAELLM